MASILVYIESPEAPAGSGPLRASLEALGEGRRLASALGATLYAFVPRADHPDAGENARDALVEALARGGADRVLLAPLPGGAWPAIWAFQGEALHAAYERVQPLLVIFPATRAGRDMAPRLAARAGATFLAEPAVHPDPGAEGVLSLPAHGGDAPRPQLALDGLERPLVVTLTPGAYAVARGEGDAAVVCLPAPDAGDAGHGPAGPRGFEYLDSAEDPGAALDTARVIVVAGAGVRTAETYALVGRLAAALGGELGATANLCALGLAPAHRAIGIGARHVAPALYVVCAASGSRAHLDAVGGNPAIIAIDTDPDAPVFRAARYGIVGPLEQVIPALIAALEGHGPAAVTS